MIFVRVRTILVLGYWVLGNIHRYWIVLLLGDIFCCSDTQHNTNQTALSTIHMPLNNYLVPLLLCTLTAAIVCVDTMLLFIKHNHCHHHRILGFFVVIALLYTSIDIGIGYWYRYRPILLDIGCLSWCRSNPNLCYATDDDRCFSIFHGRACQC